MRLDDVYVAGSSSVLGDLVPTSRAVEEGRYSAELAHDDGYRSVSICDETTPAVELGAAAGAKAIERSGMGTNLDLLLHASVGFQGLDDFATAAYLHHELLTGNGVATEVRQASNGGMAALELAAPYLAAKDAPSAALLVTSDVFAAPMHARYATQGTLYGDGGTALVITNQPQRLQVRSLCSASDTTHEGLQRAGAPWARLPGQSGWPIDTAGRVQSYLETHGPEAMLDLVSRIRATERLTVEKALAEAGIDATEVSLWVFPNMGESLTDWTARAEVGVRVEDSSWDWGRTVGHLGAGDQFAAIHSLISTLSPGDHVVVNGSGTGFTFTTAVISVRAEDGV